MRTFYKPNSRVSGGACTFTVTSTGRNKGIYVEMIKQKSWDDNAKAGAFDKDYKINLKFTEAEVADMMIICQKQKGEAKFFHSTGDTTASIKFAYYETQTGSKGITLAVTKGDKKIAVPFSFAEAIVLNEWFRFALNRIFVGDFTEHKKRMEKLAETKLSNE